MSYPISQAKVGKPVFLVDLTMSDQGELLPGTVVSLSYMEEEGQGAFVDSDLGSLNIDEHTLVQDDPPPAD